VKSGDVLADRFEVLELAGSGGMGQVFRALDRVTGDCVAVKVMHGGDARESARFVREARVLAELRHPAIVRYVAHGATVDGELYLAMEWLEGEDLEVRLAREALTVDQSIGIARRASEALAAAHARGIVHRDVKPSNLFLIGRNADDVRVLDFGIARSLGASVALTGAGGVIGTVGYMAPEQARGDAGLDARADVFALGCVLYECIAGRAAFEGTEFVAVLIKILLDDPPRLHELRADVAHGLDALVARMLSKDPSLRPADGAALASELAALDAPTPAASSRAVATVRSASLTRGEQRLLSVILAHRALRDDDRVDHTAPTLAPGSVPRGDALAALRASVEPYEPRIDRLADGSVLATIAGTGSATDLTLRAARCALSMRTTLAGASIAMATGRGSDAGRLAAGEVVERAAELARTAEPGGAVRIDEVTAGLLDACFDVGLSDPRARGLDLRGEREAVDTTRTLLGRATPFLGRDREMKALEGLLDECVTESIARAVLITAPAGVGKSRLRHEFLKGVGAGENAPAIWLSRGDPMHAGSSLRFVRQMLREVFTVSQGAALDLQCRQIEVRVARSVHPRHRQRVSEFLGQILGVHFPEEASVQLRSARRDPMLMADQMRRAWEDFVEAELAERPVLMVMDDAHWSDAASIAYVDSVLRICRDKPVMVLALARPDANTTFQELWNERGVQRIPLGGLSRRASEKFTREVLGTGVTDETVARVVTQADGNAFYLEELIRAVAAGDGDALPGTVAAMVQARIESLDPEARRLLRAASVFGEVFWDGAVAALLDGERHAGAVRATLGVLVDKEIIARLANPRFPEQSEYTFRHGVVRQVSYETLTDADRTLGHRLAAQWLERAGETDAASVADHFEKSGEFARAVPWWLRAARAAFDANDLDAVIARAERGIGCGANAGVRGELRLIQADALHWRGENEAAAVRANEAADLLPDATDEWGRAVGDAAMSALRLGQLDVLVERSGQLERAIARDNVRPGLLIEGARVVRALLNAGKSEQGLELLRKVELKSQRGSAHDPALRARLVSAKARAALDGGDVGTFHELNVEAVTEFECAGDARWACHARVNLAFARMELGMYAEAAEQLAAVLVEAGRMRLPLVCAAARHNLGWVLGRLDRLDDAIATEEEAVREFAAQNDRRAEGASRIYVALLTARAADLDRAESEARRAVELLDRFGPVLSYAKAALAKILGQRGRSSEARETAREAMDTLARHGAEEGEAFTRVVHAELLHAHGDHDAARAAIATARNRLRERAERISSPAARESFLTRVPEHARTLALATEWLDVGSSYGRE